MKHILEEINRIHSLMNINESLLNEFGENLSDVYPWSLMKGTDNIYRFKANNMIYEVEFMDDGGGSYERRYKPLTNSNMDIEHLTNKGNAIKINATVMAITLDFLRNNRKWFVVIIHPLEHRRFRLVMNFIEKNLPNEYRYDIEDGIISIYRNLVSRETKNI